MAPVKVDPARVHAFADADAFDAWLAKHHDRETEVWIRMPKKATGLPTVSTDEAIDLCLRWGWIDAIRKADDDRHFLQRYTPRGPRSVWSQINVAKVERLIGEGRMTPAGLAHMDAAKADGRWAAAYRTKGAEAPPDLIAAIDADPDARAAWDGLTAQNRFALIFRTNALKTPAGRARKIATFVEMLKRRETVYPQAWKS